MDDSIARKRDAWAVREDADNYIAEMGMYAQRRDQEIIRSFLGEGPGRILDIPCGTGRFIPLQQSLGFHVVACDYSPAMLSIAQRHEGVDLVQADIFDPPFEAASFDVILISRLMFHYPSPQDILRKVLPSLKEGGRIIFDTLNPFSSRWLTSQFIHAFNRDPAYRLYFESPQRMRQSLNAIGLEVLDWTPAYILPTRLYKYLPKVAVGMCDVVEYMMPCRVKVLSYWHVRLP